MYGKKYFEPSCAELRREHHIANGFSSKYCLNYGNLACASECAEENQMSNLNWNPFECPFGCGHHYHNGHCGHLFGQHAHHHHTADSTMAGNDLVGGGSVNELSPTSAEHVINLYDLYTNRTVDYASFNEHQTHRAADSHLAYNQEEEYYCCNLEQQTPISWLESESYRTWESQARDPGQSQHYSQHPGPTVMGIGNQTSAIESSTYLDEAPLASVTKYELDKCTVHKPSTHGSFSPGPMHSSMFACSSSSYLPFSKNRTPNGVSVNLSMNMAMSQPLPDTKPIMSSIQMRSHSTKYKLQLAERITIKEHNYNYTDVYRINQECHNYCKAKTLYSQTKHIRIDRVDSNTPASVTGHSGAQCHSTSSYGAIGGKINLCAICSKTYARPSTLKTHMRTHSGERPFRCHICEKAFSQAANLTAHIRTHSGEKPFPCPICHRQFSQSSSVTTHLRTHSGEKPYKCAICHKAFSDSSTLTKHLRIHSGDKPYKCPMCHLRFSQSGNLNRHLRIHNASNV